MRANIPLDTMNAIKRYVRDGIRPGHFLTNVLEGDLFKAAARADAESRAVFFDIVEFIAQECPIGCYGSRGAVDTWTSHESEANRATATSMRPWLRS